MIFSAPLLDWSGAFLFYRCWPERVGFSLWGFTAVFCWGSCVGFCWRRFAPRVMTGLLSFDRSFRSREGEWFFSAGFPAMCVQAQPVCWRRLAPQAGAGPFFLDEKKGSKDSPRGEFRFSPPWNPLSTTKGAAFGNREKLPLWFLLTHRHSLRVKRVCKESFHACNWYGKCSQANKKMRRSRIPHKTAS